MNRDPSEVVNVPSSKDLSRTAHNPTGGSDAASVYSEKNGFADRPSEYYLLPHQLVKQSGRELLFAVDSDKAAAFSKDEILDILRQNGIETDDVKQGIETLRANSNEYDRLATNEMGKAPTAVDTEELSIAEKNFVDYLEAKERAEQEALALLGNKEDDMGTQVEALSQREKNLISVARAIRNGKGKEVLDEHLFYYRREPVVIQFVIDDLLAKIEKKEAGDAKALDGVLNWRWEIGKTNETIANEMTESLLRGGPTEKAIYTPAFEQLKMHDFSYHEGLDAPASFVMFENLRMALRASGMSNQEISDAIEQQKDLTKKSVLFPEDIIAIRRRKVGTRASKEIPKITAEEEQAAKILPPLTFVPEVASGDEGGEDSAVVVSNETPPLPPAEEAVIEPKVIPTPQTPNVVELDEFGSAMQHLIDNAETVGSTEQNSLTVSQEEAVANPEVSQEDHSQQPADKETAAEVQRNERFAAYKEKIDSIKNALMAEHRLTKEQMEEADASGDDSWRRKAKEKYLADNYSEAMRVVSQLKDPTLSKENFLELIEEFNKNNQYSVGPTAGGNNPVIAWLTSGGRRIDFSWNIGEEGCFMGGALGEDDLKQKLEELPGAWNPEVELEKIMNAPKEERRKLLEEYKEKLRVQREGIAKMQEELMGAIRANPDMTREEYEQQVNLKQTELLLSRAQVGIALESFEKYQRKHQAVEGVFKQYPETNQLFEAAFGRAPKGKIEVIKGPMTLYFRCHDDEDYALVHSSKLNVPNSVDQKDVEHANKSGGCSNVRTKIPELYGTVIVERTEGRDFTGAAVAIYNHEEQHALHKVLRTNQEVAIDYVSNKIEGKEFIALLEQLDEKIQHASDEEKEPLLDKQQELIDSIMLRERRRLRDLRSLGEVRGADELLAYLRDGRSFHEIYNTLTQTEEDGGLYDYYNRSRFDILGTDGYLFDENTTTLSAQVQERLDYEFRILKQDVFVGEYHEVIREGLTAYKKLRDADYSEEMIRAVFQHEPLTRWEKVATRLTEQGLGISETVENKFKVELGVTYEQLEQIDGFRSLSEGQQLLVLRNMQNEVLQNVKKDADKEQKEEWKGRSLWGKIWRGATTMGSYQSTRTKTIEKELLARARGGDDADPKRAELLASHIANIEAYVKIATAGPDVEVKEGGTLDIKYASLKKVLGSFEVIKATSEDEVAVESFNKAASEFAKLPREWGYEPIDEKEKGQREKYDAEKLKYDTARAELLFVYKAKFAERGEVDPENAAMAELNRIDENLQVNQLFNAHPNAEKALDKIESQSAVWAGIKEFARDKGKYIALGIGARIAAGAVLGAATAGVGTIVGIATGGATLAGGMQGVADAKKLIRERRIDRRLSEADEREEFSYKDSSGTSRTRKIKEYTDATFFTDRIERLTSKLEEVSSEEKRSLIELRIAKTTALMEEKYQRGLVNFGGSSLESTDNRKGNDIANKLSFIQAMGKGASIEVLDQKKLEDEMRGIVGVHQGKIENINQEEIMKTWVTAASMRGAFAFSGALIAHGIHESGFVDAVFAKFAKLKEEAVIAAAANHESGVYSGADIERIRTTALAYVNPKLPKEFVESENTAMAKALAEYMSAKDSATRTAIAETMGMSEKEINERIASILTKGTSVTPAGAVTNVVATQPALEEQAASAPTPASVSSAPEAATSAVVAEARGEVTAPPTPVVVPSSPTQASGVYVPPKLVGGPGAELHQPTPDGGVPQKGWEDIAVPRVHHSPPPSTLPQEPKVQPVPQAEPLPPKWTGESAPRIKLPPPPWEVLTEPSKISAPDGTPFPRTLPLTPDSRILPPDAMSPAVRTVPLSTEGGESARMVKTSFIEDNNLQTKPATFAVERAPYSGMEQQVDKALAPMLLQARTAFGSAVDRPAIEVMSELKASGNSLYKPFEQFSQKGYTPESGESAIAFYERCTRAEFLKIKMPAATLHQTGNESINAATPEARFSRNVDRLWTKMLWKNSHHEYLTDSKGTVEDLLSGKIGVDASDVNGVGLKYWQGSICTLVEKSGVVPEHGEHVEAYGKRAVAEMLRKNPALTREDILQSGRDVVPTPKAVESMVPSKPTSSTTAIPEGVIKAPPIEQIIPQVKPTAPEALAGGQLIQRGGTTTPPAMNEAVVNHTKEIADKWSEAARVGRSNNFAWPSARDESATTLISSKIDRGIGANSGQDARLEMQALLKKAEGMGFRPSSVQKAGEFLDQVAKELHEPMSENSLGLRANAIENVLAKNIPALRSTLAAGFPAERILSNTEIRNSLNTQQSISEALMLQKILQRVVANTGVTPKPGQSTLGYLNDAIREQLKKTPTLHMNSLLASKEIIPPLQPLKAPTLVPSPTSIPKAPLRWDQQA